MTLREFRDVAYDAQNAEQELASLKARVEPLLKRQLKLASRVHDLTSSLGTYLEEHVGEDRIVKCGDWLYWIDPINGVCSQELVEAWQLPDGEPHEPVDNNSLSDPEIQLAIQAFTVGEDSDIEAIADGVSGIIVP